MTSTNSTTVVTSVAWWLSLVQQVWHDVLGLLTHWLRCLLDLLLGDSCLGGVLRTKVWQLLGYACQGVDIGNHVRWDSGIRFPSILSPLVVGTHTHLHRNVEFICGDGIHIGRGCVIESGVRFVSQSYALGLIQTRQGRYRAEEPLGSIELEDVVWVGTNSVILGGVRIGAGSVVLAGSVVQDDVSPLTVVGGRPAVVLGRVACYTVKEVETYRPESRTSTPAVEFFSPSPHGSPSLLDDADMDDLLQPHERQQSQSASNLLSPSSSLSAPPFVEEDEDEWEEEEEGEEEEGLTYSASSSSASDEDEFEAEEEEEDWDEDEDELEDEEEEDEDDGDTDDRTLAYLERMNQQHKQAVTDAIISRVLAEQQQRHQTKEAKAQARQQFDVEVRPSPAKRRNPL